MYFKPHEDPNFQNLQSYLPLELQHSQPKKASSGVMGPPLYTVSGMVANVEKEAEKEGQGDNGGEVEDHSEEDQENSLGKRTRAAANGAPDPKKSRV